jgi:hypothetical protein
MSGFGVGIGVLAILVGVGVLNRLYKHRYPSYN